MKGDLRTVLKRFLTDRRAVAAIEFAFVAPVLFVMYFVTLEVAQGIETNKKVGRVASMVGDLVAQQTGNIPLDEMDGILEIGAAIIQPYQRSLPHIIVTGIQMGPAPAAEATVAWSRQLEENETSRALPEGTEVTVPEELRVPDSFLVRVTTELNYQPVITWSASGKETLGLAAAFDDLAMSETYYLRPRMGAPLTCDDC